LKGLRGTALDPFGYSCDRKLDRQLIVEYEAIIDHIVAGLTAGNLEAAVRLAAISDDIRGYGPVKETYVANARKRAVELRADFDHVTGPALMAAE
jgi:indolepyruvate ferredoxin oxidoreductase